MANYKSDEVTLLASADKVFDRLSDVSRLGEMLKEAPMGELPDAERELMEQVRIEGDSITFPAGPAGELTLKLSELVRPTLIRMTGIGAPVPMGMTLHIQPVGDFECRAQVDIEIEIPKMLAPMVGGPLKKMAAQIAEMLVRVPFN